MLVKRTFIMAPYKIIGKKMLQKWQIGQSLLGGRHTCFYGRFESKKNRCDASFESKTMHRIYFFPSEASQRGVYGVRKLFSRKPSSLYNVGMCLSRIELFHMRRVTKVGEVSPNWPIFTPSSFTCSPVATLCEFHDSNWQFSLLKTCRFLVLFEHFSDSFC